MTPGGRIRVARVITRLNVGGPAIQAMLLTTRLDPSRFESVLVSGRLARGEADMRDVRPEPALSSIVLGRLRREISPVDDAVALCQLVRLFARWRPDVVHTHLSKAGALGRVAARIARVPVVVHTYHGNVLSGYFGRSQSRILLAVERVLARVSTRVIAISRSQAQELARLRIAPASRIVELPLGLDLEPFLHGDADRSGFTNGWPRGPVVGIIARLVPIKRVDLFLEAATIVAERVPGATFVVVGDGELRAALEEQARRAHIGDRVRFLGWRSDLPDVYAGLDVAVLSSDNEGTPVSAIEALASSRPVVATDVGGVRDVVAHGEVGLVVPPRDGRAIADAVVELLTDGERRTAMGRCGRERVLRSHGAASLVERMERLYVELTSGT